jgi:hypothetical protein
MTSTAARGRKAAAAAQQRAAKERRQRFMAIGLVGLLVVVLAFEIPKLMKAGSTGSSSSTAAPVVAAPAPVSAAQTAQQSKALKAALKQSPRDVFDVQQGRGSQTTLGSVATPPGLHDPFAAPHSSQAAVVPVVTAPPKTPQLPGKIVLGTPGAGKVAETGWIVILASIPTDAGQSSATSFAKTAGKAGVGKISILNSSNRKPLRGGFWVVYTGPYGSLTQVSAAADNIHKSGFTSAYIRELVVYKAKLATTKSKSKKK